MKVLVTGAHGFVGQHLVRALRAAEHQVIEPTALNDTDGFNLASRPQVEELLKSAPPDAIMHLAAVSSVAQSHREPEQTFEVNALGTVNLLAAVRRVCPGARLLIVGSCEVYGRSLPGTLIDESTPLRPLSPYAASKAAAEQAALQFHESYGTNVVCARPFAHLGAGQAPNFVVPSFASQLAAIRRGDTPPVIKTGDLSPIRDFLHVTDVVAAYLLLLRAGSAGGVYNVASGTGRTVKSLLDEMIHISGIDARYEVDPERMRPVEIPELVGDPARLQSLGWVATLDVHRALTDVLEEQGAFGSTPLAPHSGPS